MSCRTTPDVPIVAIGPVARRALKPGAVGEVRAVFARSFYVVLGGDWVCFGPRALGNGPLNALYDGAGRGVAVGMPARVGGDDVRIGPTTFDFGAAALWQPDRGVADPDALAAGLDALEAWLPGATPQDGLAVLIAPEIRGAATPVARAATHAARHLSGVVGASAAADFEPLRPLLGLGPGLTPSGDDFLGGALVALHGLGLADRAGALGAWLAASAPGRTNDLSLAHLAAAAQGYGSAALHETVQDLIQGRAAQLGADLARIDAIGHTSGWDALAGAVIVLRAWRDACRRRRRPPRSGGPASGRRGVS